MYKHGHPNSSLKNVKHVAFTEKELILCHLQQPMQAVSTLHVDIVTEDAKRALVDKEIELGLNMGWHYSVTGRTTG